MVVTPQLLERFATLRALTLKTVCLSAEAISQPLSRWDRKHYPEEVNSIVDNLRAHVQNSQHAKVLDGDSTAEGTTNELSPLFDSAPALLQGLVEIEKFLRPLAKVTEGRELRSSAQLQASLALAVASASEAAAGAVGRANASIGVIYGEGAQGTQLYELCGKLQAEQANCSAASGSQDCKSEGGGLAVALETWHKSLALELTAGLSAIQAREAAKKKKKKRGLGIGTTHMVAYLERITDSAPADVPAQKGPPPAGGEGAEQGHAVAKECAEYFDAVLAGTAPGDATVAAELDGIQQVVDQATQGVNVKAPRGTRDIEPNMAAVRAPAFATIRRIFRLTGAVEIDTPSFELRWVLMNKYGEDQKLIYELEDQGGELCCLRYDLTVPLARYMAERPTVKRLARFHIGKVFRRDNPKPGRYREFFQCDYDVVGDYARMIPETQCLWAIATILRELKVGTFELKVNHRGILDGMMAVAGVPPSNFRPVCSAIDKLDKAKWETVKAEMTTEKNVPEDVADKLGVYVTLKSEVGSPGELVTKIRSEYPELVANKQVAAGLDDLDLLFRYLATWGVADVIRFDLSLARGLDYYTGTIYEGVLTSGEGLGSICGGGRYDNLIGSLRASGGALPACGISLGIERVFQMMWDKAQTSGAQIKSSGTLVLVASVGKGLLNHRMEVAKELLEAGLPCEFFAQKENPRTIAEQLAYAAESQIPLAVILGESEIAAGQVQIREIDLGQEKAEERKQETVARGEMESSVRSLLAELGYL